MNNPTNKELTQEKLNDMDLLTRQELMDMFNPDLCSKCYEYLINDICPEGCK